MSTWKGEEDGGHVVFVKLGSVSRIVAWSAPPLAGACSARTVICVDPVIIDLWKINGVRRRMF